MDLEVFVNLGTIKGADTGIPIEHACIYDPVYQGDDPYRVESPFVMPADLDQGFYNMPFEKYLGYPLPDYSFYKEFSRSPAHGLACLDEQKKPPGTVKQKNFDFGSALHWLVLEPDKFERNVVVDPGINKNRNDYKEWRSRLPKDSIVLDSEQVDTAMRMRDKLMRKPTIRRLLEEPGKCELTGIFQDPQFGLWHKIRIDKLLSNYPIVVDYKTAISASAFGFQRARYLYDYDLQAALYLSGLKMITRNDYKKWVWIVQEKEPPYEPRIEIAEPEQVWEATDKLKVFQERLAECIHSGYWPGYFDVDSSWVFEDEEIESEPDLLPW